MEPLVYVVLLNWERPVDTAECIESLAKSHYENQRIVVVDNGSSDGSAQRLRQQFPDVCLLETGANLGFAGGMNKGIAFALDNGADFALLLNNDAVVDQDMLRQLVNAARIRPEYGILGPTVLFYNDRDRIWYTGGRRYWYWPAIVSLHPHVSEPGVIAVIPVDVVSGCGMLISRSVIESVGLFDTMFFMYYEDSDFCLRAREKGYRVGYVPLARMWHKVSSSTIDDIPTRIYMRTKSKAIFYKRYARGLATITTWPFIMSSAIWSVSQYTWTGRTSQLKHYLSGLICGLSQGTLPSPLGQKTHQKEGIVSDRDPQAGHQ